MKKSEITKKKILEAAKHQFSQKGLYGARIDEIAAEAQINKRMLYEYYGNKETLYTFVLEAVYQELNQEENLIFSGNGDYEEALRSIVATYFQFLHTHPEFVRMLMWENLENGTHLKLDAFGGIRDIMVNSISSLIQRGKELGKIRQDVDEKQVILTLISCSFNYFSNLHTLSRVLHMDLNLPANMESRVNDVTNMVLQYISR